MESVSAFATYQAQLAKQAEATNKKRKSEKETASTTPSKVKKSSTLVGESRHVAPQSPAEKPKKQSSAFTNKVSNQGIDSPHQSHQKPSNGTAEKSIHSLKRKKALVQNENITSSTPARKSEMNISNMQCGNDGSIVAGLEIFAKLIAPTTVDEFMRKHWEQSPICIGRKQPGFYDFLKVSSNGIDEMLRNNHIQYTKNIDVTSYENGVRETHNPEGRAMPDSVWDFYNDGCSVRLLNPQTYMPTLHRFNAALQEYFHCFVGANIYLTPQNSQGFAPHYDDIEAFVLQIEGKKKWRLYKSRSQEEMLPRESSGNFNQAEIGEPILEKVLEPGDILYFPRGTIHQAQTVQGHNSLHITLSVYQKTAYADLFEELMKKTLQTTFTNNIDHRRGLPLDIWHHFGIAHEGNVDKAARRLQIENHIKGLFNDFIQNIDIDDAVDKLAIKYQHEALPPSLGSNERKLTAFGLVPTATNDGTMELPKLGKRTEIRLLRANIVRLTMVNGEYSLYYYVDNSKEYQEYDANFMELDDIAADVVKKLIERYPNYVKVNELSENSEDALMIVRSLWAHGILMTKTPLNNA